FYLDELDLDHVPSWFMCNGNTFCGRRVRTPVFNNHLVIEPHAYPVIEGGCENVLAVCERDLGRRNRREIFARNLWCWRPGGFRRSVKIQSRHPQFIENWRFEDGFPVGRGAIPPFFRPFVKSNRPIGRYGEQFLADLVGQERQTSIALLLELGIHDGE